MIGNYTAELWRPLSCCLWPYWMSYSQGTQSPFRAWINGSWLDFGGLLCCFCLLWHLPSLCEVFVLLPDKGATSSDRGREKRGDRNWGRGITERDRQGCFLSFLVVLRSAALFFAGINVSIYAFMSRSLQSWSTNMYRQRACMSALWWNLINFVPCMSILGSSATIMFLFCSCHWAPFSNPALFSRGIGKWKKNMAEKQRKNPLAIKSPKFPRIHYTRKCKSRWHPVLCLIASSNDGSPSWNPSQMKAACR